MTGYVRDFEYALRQMRKAPGFALAAILTIALAITANSTVFSWIQSTLFRPIPAVAHTGDMFSVGRGAATDSPTPPLSYLDLRDLEERNHTLAGLLGYHDDWMAITGLAKPLRAYGALTTANYFEVLHVHAAVGRTFLPGEEQISGGPAVVVLGYALWQAHFAGDASIVGRTIEINRHPFTVIGIAPPEFVGCKTGLRTDLWTPLTNDAMVWGSDRIRYRDVHWLNVLGKRRYGVSLSQAEDELNRLMQQLAVETPEAHRGPNNLSLYPLWRSPFGANVYLAASLPVLLGLAGIVLLLASANVATLLLVRSVSRRREIAIRLALGARRWQVMRQQLMESLLLSGSGGMVAVLLTSWSAGTLASFIPQTSTPITLNGRVDGTVLLATLLISGIAGLLFGILPAVHTARLAPIEVLKQEAGTLSVGASKARFSSSLVVAQIAMSMVLLVAAGLFLRTLRNTQRADPGFSSSHLLLASFDLDPSGTTRQGAVRFHRELMGRLASLPGVDAAALADWVPLALSRRTDDVLPEGYVPRLHESMETLRARVTPGYFRTMRIALMRGRDFAEDDDLGSQPVVIVDQAMAARYWPHSSVLGRRVRIQDRWATIIGVAHNSQHHRRNGTPEPMVYLSLYQFPATGTIIHLRTSNDPQSAAAAIESTVHALDANLPVYDVMTLTESMRLSSIFERLSSVFVGAFGLIALALATVGIYGVVAYTTRQRTHEIGIRIALGASRGHILGLVLGQGARLIAAGSVLGLAASFLVTRMLRSSLYGVSATDPLTLITVSLLLCAVALLACYAPARRATRIDPAAAVHTD